MTTMDQARTGAAQDLPDYFYFSRDHLWALAAEHGEAFRSAKPFPHIYFDDFLPGDVAREIGRTFPGPFDIDWRLAGPGDTKHSNNPKIEKLSTSDEQKMPPYIRHVMYGFQSGIFCDFVGRLAGLNHLAPDPSFHGCGLHSTGPGGRLMVHLDASRHPNQDMRQVINCLYYCTPDWKPEYGGALELWSDNNGKAHEHITQIEPKFNRLAVFYTGKSSWHGHPKPLTSPDHMRRNSLATYYYTTDESQADIPYTNYVGWARTNEHDRPSIKHRVKAGIRKYLPQSTVNKIATAVRRHKR